MTDYDCRSPIQLMHFPQNTGKGFSLAQLGSVNPSTSRTSTVIVRTWVMWLVGWLVFGSQKHMEGWASLAEEVEEGGHH